MSFFAQVETAAADAVFGLNQAYKEDVSPQKLNLGVGAYRTAQGLPYVLDVVRKAEKRLVEMENNKEYLSMDCLPDLRQVAPSLMLGPTSPAIKENRVAASQSLGGTGALRLALAFIKNYLGDRTIYISSPTWGNHGHICNQTGLPFKKYRYYKADTRGLDFEGMTEDIKGAAEGSVIMLHACAHNPTGVDPSPDQWRQLHDLLKEKKLFPLFDCAYQGFISGDPDKDVDSSVREFDRRGELEFIVCQSFSKNFGLYGERVGCVSFVCQTAEVAARVQSQMKRVIRGMYSNPPSHGARVVSLILNDAELAKQWREELKLMSGRILGIRKDLLAALTKLNTPGDWSHVVNQCGMFTFTGLSPEQVDKMTQKHHIYMLRNGRISLAGLKSTDIDYMARAIHDVVTN